MAQELAQWILGERLCHDVLLSMDGLQMPRSISGQGSLHASDSSSAVVAELVYPLGHWRGERITSHGADLA